jgi:hypothetical protein
VTGYRPGSDDLYDLVNRAVGFIKAVPGLEAETSRTRDMVLKIIPAAKSIKATHMMGPVNKSYNDINYLPVKFRMISRLPTPGITKKCYINAFNLKSCLRKA